MTNKINQETATTMLKEKLGRFMDCVASDLCAIVSNIADDVNNTIEYSVSIVNGHTMIIPSCILVRCISFAEENGLHFSLLVYQDRKNESTDQNLRFCFIESEDYNLPEHLNPNTDND